MNLFLLLAPMLLTRIQILPINFLLVNPTYFLSATKAYIFLGSTKGKQNNRQDQWVMALLFLYRRASDSWVRRREDEGENNKYSSILFKRRRQAHEGLPTPILYNQKKKKEKGRKGCYVSSSSLL
jgi:hypothetical protein